MNGRMLAGFALLAAAAFFGARHWQSVQQTDARTGEAVDCDLLAGPCRQSVAGGWVDFSIEPASVPLMKTLALAVTTQGLDVRGVTVEIRGLNMDMGLNRTPLSRAPDGRWTGETILPVCSQRRMEWEAAVQLDAGPRLEVPFAFRTERP